MECFKYYLRCAFMAFAIVILPFSATAQELITGLSNETIYITSDFNGSELVVFGTINNLQRLTKTQDKEGTIGDYDIVVVIEGPAEEGVVRKKARTGGIWINNDSVGFEMIPSSYLMMTSKPQDENTLNESLSALKIGLNHASFGNSENKTVSTAPQDFRTAVVRLRKADGLFWQGTGINFLGDNLFRARFEIPALIPVGNHTVKSYLFVEGELVSDSSHIVEITKTGFEQLMFDFSYDYGYLYGIFCVILAIVTGWLSSVIFRRS